jgi:hypothetical protein
MRIFNLFSLLLFFIIFLQPAFSQTGSDKTFSADTYNKAVKQYGPDDILVFGKVYFKLHYKADGYPFLQTDDFLPGEVFIGNNVYTEVPLLYDIERQIFVIKAITQDKAEKLVWLNPKRIDSVMLQGRLFIHSAHLPYELPRIGYFEIFGEDDLKLMIFHTKYYKPVRNITGDNSVGAYSKRYDVRILHKDGKLYKVNSRRSFLKVFDEDKRQLRQFIRKKRIRYRKAEPEQLQSLMNFCNEKLSQ